MDFTSKGRRVELMFTSDPYTRLRPGTRGTVSFVDDMGTVFVDWDDGSSLGLIPGQDHWKYIKEGDTDEQQVEKGSANSVGDRTGSGNGSSS